MEEGEGCRPRPILNNDVQYVICIVGGMRQEIADVSQQPDPIIGQNQVFLEWLEGVMPTTENCGTMHLGAAE
jgi:hypothetical protein